MMINNGSQRTDAEVVEAVVKALLARRAHAQCVHVKVETEVSVHNGIHTQWDIHRVAVDVDDTLVWFYRYRQHSPCRSKYRYQVSEPYGFEGLKIRADKYTITVEY